MRVNLRSRGRALLMLFLFSEVSADDAPTQVGVGSHLDVPQFLEAAGDDGVAWTTLCQKVVPASAGRPIELATGSLGGVYLCHPFLVHTGDFSSRSNATVHGPATANIHRVARPGLAESDSSRARGHQRSAPLTRAERCSSVSNAGDASTLAMSSGRSPDLQRRNELAAGHGQVDVGGA
jgi:hypothetical protein